MQFQVIMVTDSPTHKHTHRRDRLQYTAPQLAHSVMNKMYAEHYEHEFIRHTRLNSLKTKQDYKTKHVHHDICPSHHITPIWAPCGLQGCNLTRSVSWQDVVLKATKPGLVFVLYLSMLYNGIVVY